MSSSVPPLYDPRHVPPLYDLLTLTPATAFLGISVPHYFPALHKSQQKTSATFFYALLYFLISCEYI